MPLRLALGDAEQLDAVAELLRVANVGRRQARDAFDIRRVEVDRHTECDRREQRELVGSVDALDVEGRVSFGVAQALGFSQHRAEGLAARAHLGQDEVAGAIDDARQPFDPISGQALAQRLDDRNSSANRCLECHHHAAGARGLEDLVAMTRQQRLVRGDHVLAQADRLEHQRARGLVAADQLDDDVDIRLPDDVERLGRYRQLAAEECPRLGRVTHRHRGDLDAAAGASRDLMLVAPQDAAGSAADGAQPEQADFDRIHGHGDAVKSSQFGVTPRPA